MPTDEKLRLHRKTKTTGTERAERCLACQSPARVEPWPNSWVCLKCFRAWQDSRELDKAIESERHAWREYYSHEFEERRDGRIAVEPIEMDLMPAFQEWLKTERAGLIQ